jgi:predicted DNA-binding protein (MmcQ/YjbR family)
LVSPSEMRKQIQVGSIVVVRLYDGREVEAKITAIVDSVAGRKVRIAYGLIALKIDPEQIIREVRCSPSIKPSRYP